MPQNSASEKTTRHKLVRIATKLYEEHGADLPLRTVWERAGIGHGKFKRMFPSRESLIAQVVDEEFASLLEWSRNPLPEDVGNGMFVGWIKVLTQTLLNCPDLAGLLLTAHRRPGSPLHPMSVAIASITDQFLKEHLGTSAQTVEIESDQLHVAVLAATSAAEKLFPGRWDEMIDDRFAAVDDQLWSIRFALERSA